MGAGGGEGPRGQAGLRAACVSTWETNTNTPDKASRVWGHQDRDSLRHRVVISRCRLRASGLEKNAQVTARLSGGHVDSSQA